MTIGNQVFDEFIQQPFQTCNGSFVEAEITFKQTDDPYFYDLHDPRNSKIEGLPVGCLRI